MSLDDAIVATAIKKMLDKGWFDICTFNELVRMTGALVPSSVRARLRPLHCIQWNEMPDEVREWVWDAINEAFITGDRLPQLVIENGKAVLLTPRSRFKKLLGG